MAICLLAAPALAPPATADPREFPDLSGYHAVNGDEYRTYATYGIQGVQFATPGGYRCRMSTNFKASRQMMDCWGVLPGTTRNHVGLVTQSKQTMAAAFSDVDLSTMETYDFGPAEGPAGNIDPKDYKPLAPQDKLSYAGFTCGVDPITTACQQDDPSTRHGFVLSSLGSWTF
ncbi:hypothetical protein [Mycobacterium paraffinicum]|uniref:hypothetical protein n=1 Tax=Mycobacterium paraffinicum TaxID=53378 RepID=UPI001114D028|nr:hypothetical protein [Mycobacterium paraffinicum]